MTAARPYYGDSPPYLGSAGDEADTDATDSIGALESALDRRAAGAAGHASNPQARCRVVPTAKEPGLKARLLNSPKQLLLYAQ